MAIRPSRKEDVEKILEIYELAKKFMRENKNPNQWDDYYPSREILLADINRKVSYLYEEDGEILATFAFIIGEDETYKIIEKGAWSSDKEYGTIHRIAKKRKIKNFSKITFDFCLEKIDYLRIDTHKDNIPMQKAIRNYGFKKCGIIYVRNHMPRLAFDYMKE